jgi:molecular chaperone HscB
MPTEFLMEQMALREALDDASTSAELDVLTAQLNTTRSRALERLATLLDVDADPIAAAQQVRALMFVERFGEDVKARLDRLETSPGTH